MVAAALHRRMLILGVCLFCLPFHALAMGDDPSEKDEPFEDDGYKKRTQGNKGLTGGVQDIEENAFLLDFIKDEQQKEEREKQTPPRNLASEGKPSSQPLFLPRDSQASGNGSKTLNSSPRATSSQNTTPRDQNRIRRSSTSRGKSGNPPNVSVPESPTVGSRFSRYFTSAESEAKKLNSSIFMKYKEIENYINESDLSPVKLYALEFFIAREEARTIRLIPKDGKVLVTNHKDPRELAIFVNDSDKLCCKIPKKGSIEIRKSNKREMGHLEAGVYNRFLEMISRLQYARSDYFPAFQNGTWNDEELCKLNADQKQDLWDLEKLLTCLAEMTYSLQEKSTRLMPPKRKGENIKPEEILDKLFESKISFLIKEEDDRKNWKDIEVPTFELIIDVIEFLKTRLKSDFSTTEIDPYNTVLDEAFYTCCRALCCKEVSEKKYYYYNAKHLTLKKFYGESWYNIQKCLDALSDLFKEAGANSTELGWLLELKKACFLEGNLPNFEILNVPQGLGMGLSKTCIARGNNYIDFGNYLKKVNELSKKSTNEPSLEMSQPVDLKVIDLYLSGVQQYYSDREFTPMLIAKSRDWDPNTMYAVACKAFNSSTLEKNDDVKRDLDISNDLLDDLIKNNKSVDRYSLEVFKSVLPAVRENDSLEIKKLRARILGKMIDLIEDIKTQDIKNKFFYDEFDAKILNIYYEVQSSEISFNVKTIFDEWKEARIENVLQFVAQPQIPYTSIQGKMIRELLMALSEMNYQGIGFELALKYLRDHDKWVAANNIVALVPVGNTIEKSLLQEINENYEAVEKYKKSLESAFKTILNLKKPLFFAQIKNCEDVCKLITAAQLESLQGSIDDLPSGENVEQDEYTQSLYKTLGLEVPSYEVYPEKFEIVNIDISMIKNSIQRMIYNMHKKKNSHEDILEIVEDPNLSLDQIRVVIEYQETLEAEKSKDSSK